MTEGTATRAAAAWVVTKTKEDCINKMELTHRDFLTTMKIWYLDQAQAEEHGDKSKAEYYRNQARRIQLMLDVLGEVADQAV